MSEANRSAQPSYPDGTQVPMEMPEAISGRQGGVASPEWETVNFPGSLPLEDLPVDAPIQAPRESELLNLIHDLNRCNEVLLSRVNHLEESLETAQQALQAEVEHSQHHQSNTEHSVSAAQQHSTAQLLSELEGANDALKRQRILSETLQAQLESSQERVIQLERECTLLQQQHTTRSQALQQSEETCRDLRSRLQRQQRYTLQFKVALEKCLDMSAPQQMSNGFNGVGSPLETQVRTQERSDLPQKHVSMPRADRIQPWSSVDGDPLPDAQLAALLKATASHKQAEPEASQSVPSPETVPANPADAQLWQDLERVVEQAPTFSTASAEATAETVEATEPTANVEPQPGFTEPMPWGPPKTKVAELSKPSGVSQVDAATPTEPVPPLGRPSSQPDPGIPETTTWPPTHSPIPGDSSPTLDVQASEPKVVIPEIPLLKMPITHGTSPSPIVHPLRPQKKKLKSLSAVDLPSFPRPPQNAKAQ